MWNIHTTLRAYQTQLVEMQCRSIVLIVEGSLLHHSLQEIPLRSAGVHMILHKYAHWTMADMYILAWSIFPPSRCWAMTPREAYGIIIQQYSNIFDPEVIYASTQNSNISFGFASKFKWNATYSLQYSGT